MKTLKKIVWGGLLAFSLVVSTALPAQAQAVSKGYFNIDWQFNALLDNSYADRASGWGMNFEGGYYVIPKLAVGAFISYHTNNKYIGRQTLHLSETSSMNTDQQHSLFQLPFGVLLKYRFILGKMCEPYATVKLGTDYSRMSTYYQAWERYDDTWGFTVSPEIGLSFYPVPSQRFGFHLALYYLYSTNDGKVLIYRMNGRNNIGFRLGVAF